MAHKSLVRAGVLVATTAMIGLAAAPAGAATIVSQSSASALEVSIAGNPIELPGAITATHDGSKETVTGATTIPLPGLGVIDIGVLTQQARAGVDGLNGVSSACAGAAGSGSVALIDVGDSDCLSDADNIDLSLGALDLTGLLDLGSVDGNILGSLLGGLNLGGLLTPLTGVGGVGAINGVLDGFDLDSLGVTASLGVVQAKCVAAPGTATGSANIAGAQLSIAGVPIVNFPVDPAPNTKVIVDLDLVINAVLEGLKVQLTTAVNGALAGLAPTVEQVQGIVTQIVGGVADNLGPVQDTLIDITLNKQSSSGAGQISVTALDLQLLPLLGELGVGDIDSLIAAEIGQVSCGPNSTVAGPTPPTDLPKVPTAIAAGEDGSNTEGAVIAGLVALSLAVGVGGRRWYVTKR